MGVCMEGSSGMAAPSVCVQHLHARSTHTQLHLSHGSSQQVPQRILSGAPARTGAAAPQQAEEEGAAAQALFSRTCSTIPVPTHKAKVVEGAAAAKARDVGRDVEAVRTQVRALKVGCVHDVLARLPCVLGRAAVCGLLAWLVACACMLFFLCGCM